MLHGTSSPDATTVADGEGGWVDDNPATADVVASATVDEEGFDVETEVGGTVTREVVEGAALPSAPQPAAMAVTTTARATGHERRGDAVIVRRSALPQRSGIDWTVAKAILRRRARGPMALGTRMPGRDGGGEP